MQCQRCSAACERSGPERLASDGSLALHKAADRGSIGIVTLLLSNEADVNARWENGETALHLVALRGFADIVAELLLSGADVDAVCQMGDTPLHQACGQGYERVVMELLAKGANMNAINAVGRTPLYKATMRGCSRTVATLLAHGADPNEAARSGRTPLIEATVRDYRDIVTVLLAHGARVNPATHRGKDRSTSCGFPLPRRDRNAAAGTRRGCKCGGYVWETVLGFAIARDENAVGDSIAADNIAAALLSRGADVNFAPPTGKGCTALHEGTTSEQDNSHAASRERCEFGRSNSQRTHPASRSRATNTRHRHRVSTAGGWCEYRRCRLGRIDFIELKHRHQP